MKALFVVISLALLSGCGASVGSAPVSPLFQMETKITRVSPEAKSMVIEIHPYETETTQK